LKNQPDQIRIKYLNNYKFGQVKKKFISNKIINTDEKTKSYFLTPNNGWRNKKTPHVSNRVKEHKIKNHCFRVKIMHF
jgi:hypothetical protein